MSYRNLPAVWSPGLAVPDYAKVEGLQRRAFVTKWQPRGTYDHTRLPRTGYAVPGYIVDEAYGQGARTTKWQPRGTQPRFGQTFAPQARLVAATRATGGGTEYTIASGTATPGAAGAHVTDPLRTFGQRAADHVMTKLRAVPAAHRATALRRLLDKVDPRLWSRVHATRSKAIRAGIPAARALHHAIATEFHQGLVRELQTVGKTGSVKKQSIAGMGCYGCAAMLGLGTDERGRKGGPPAPVTQVGAASIPCGSKNAAGTLIQPCNPNLKLPTMITVGPLRFQAGARDHRYRYTDPKAVPAAVLAWVNKQVDPHVGGGAGSAGDAEKYWFGYAYQLDHDYYSSDESKMPGKPIVDGLADPVQPSVPYGVFLFLAPPDPHCDSQGCAPPLLALLYAPANLGAGGSGLLDKISGALGGAGGSISGFVSAAGNAIGQAACQALSTPGAQVAAMAAGGPAAGAGAAAAASLCSKSQSATPTAPAPTAPAVTSAPGGMSHTTKLLLLVGGGLGAAYLATRK